MNSGTVLPSPNTHATDEELAQGLGACDWSGVPIGYKSIIAAAMDRLLRRPEQHDPHNPDPDRAIAFGHGKLIVDTGTFYERPAVFIMPTDNPGQVGAKVPDELKGDLNVLEPGEHVLTFPTLEQAKFVADALMGRTAPAPALSTPPVTTETVSTEGGPDA